MLNGVPLPGKTKPTARDQYRAQIGPKVDWLTPGRAGDAQPDQPGTIVCPRCHAISLQKRWFLDEALFQRLRSRPSTRVILCPGCRRVEQQLYEGEVVLRGDILAANKPQALSLIRHEEAQARAVNPFSQIASIEDRGNEIAVLTTTIPLAERIGKAFHRAFKGTLNLQYLPGEKFVRVRWKR